METLEFVSPVVSGKLLPVVSTQIRRVMESMEGKRIRLKIQEAKKQRSCQQNRFYFGAIVPAVREIMKQYGQNLTLDETHDMIVRHIWKRTKYVFMPDGSRQEVRLSSTEENTTSWEQAIEQTRAYFAQAGHMLPYPETTD